MFSLRVKQRYLMCSIWTANNLFPYIIYKSFQRQLFDIQSSAGGKERLLWRQCTLEMTTCSRHKSVLHWQFLITYFFLRISKVCSLLYYGWVGWVQNEECYLYLHILLRHFFAGFSQRNWFSISSHSWWSIKFL